MLLYVMLWSRSQRVVDVGGDRVRVTARIEMTNSCSLARVVQLPCVDLEPLLDLLSTHGAFRRSDRDM